MEAPIIEGQVTCEKDKRHCVGRNGIRKAEAHFKLNLVRDMKGNKRVSTSTPAAKEKPGKICPLCWMRNGSK